MKLDQLQEFYRIHLGSKTEAIEWLELYTMLVHLSDDVVDETDLTVEEKIEAFTVAKMVWSHPFYLKYQPQLSMVDELNTVAFLDAEKWKKSDEHWKRLSAEVLRHQCYNMFFAVVLITCGRKVLREISTAFREFTHLKHLNDTEDVFTKVAA